MSYFTLDGDVDEFNIGIEIFLKLSAHVTEVDLREWSLVLLLHEDRIPSFLLPRDKHQVVEVVPMNHSGFSMTDVLQDEN